MSVTLPLNEMTLSEKLEVMETLWQDLSRNAEALESPDWHKTVLDEREQKIQSGKSQFLDWQQVKADLRKLAE
jgi:putative addiction module component (TIGR02574 family)